MKYYNKSIISCRLGYNFIILKFECIYLRNNKLFKSTYFLKIVCIIIDCYTYTIQLGNYSLIFQFKLKKKHRLKNLQ